MTSMLALLALMLVQPAQATSDPSSTPPARMPAWRGSADWHVLLGPTFVLRGSDVPFGGELSVWRIRVTRSEEPHRWTTPRVFGSVGLDAGADVRRTWVELQTAVVVPFLAPGLGAGIAHEFGKGAGAEFQLSVWVVPNLIVPDAMLPLPVFPFYRRIFTSAGSSSGEWGLMAKMLLH